MIREQKIYYLARKYISLATPKIRIANKFLSENNFNIGDRIKIDYSKNKIIITKLEREAIKNEI